MFLLFFNFLVNLDCIVSLGSYSQCGYWPLCGSCIFTAHFDLQITTVGHHPIRLEL